jgi:hypothetical protein
LQDHRKTANPNPNPNPNANANANPNPNTLRLFYWFRQRCKRKTTARWFFLFCVRKASR